MLKSTEQSHMSPNKRCTPQEKKLHVPPSPALGSLGCTCGQDASGTLTYEEFQAHMSNPVAGVPRILANRDKSRKRDARRERERERETCEGMEKNCETHENPVVAFIMKLHCLPWSSWILHENKSSYVSCFSRHPFLWPLNMTLSSMTIPCIRSIGEGLFQWLGHRSRRDEDHLHPVGLRLQW